MTGPLSPRADPATPAAADSDLPRRLDRQPALDGLRAVAVVMVFAFHLELPRSQGGYLGVSLFFTLSGFLITRLLLHEHGATGRITLRTFYARRIRRLLPASLLALLLVIVIASFGGYPPSDRLPASTFAALASVFNWYELLGGRSYADLFAAPDPLAHFWSLAIEEQFYWLWPLTLAALLPFVPARRRTAGLAVLATLASISAPLTAALWSSAAAYLATWTRAAEVLIGAVIAGWTSRSVVPPWCRHLTVPAGLAILVVTIVTPDGRGWAFEGGLPLFAVLGALLIVGLQVPSRPAALLASEPLIWIGALSYGIYLFHWPVIVWLTQERTGLGRWPLVAVQIALTMVLAWLSARLVERPIRLGALGRLGGPRLEAGALVAGITAVAIGAVVLIPAPAPPLADAPTVVTAAPGTAAPITAPPITAAPADTSGPVSSDDGSSMATTVPAVPATPTTIAIFGDSVPAWLLRDAVPTFDRTDVTIVNGSAEACDGMVDLPLGRDRRLVELRPPDSCKEWPETYPVALAAVPEPVDVAILVLGQAPTVDRLVDGEWIHPCTSTEWYLDDISARVEFLRSNGVSPIFALPARPGTGATYVIPDDVADRLDCIRDDLTELLTELGVPIVDLDDVMCPDDDCDRIRGIDGVHVDAEHAPEVLDWLLDSAITAARES